MILVTISQESWNMSKKESIGKSFDQEYTLLILDYGKYIYL